MTKPGRNAPCPCGSSKKYKHCCLAAEQRSLYTRADREAAREHLQELLRGSLARLIEDCLEEFEPLELDRTRVHDDAHLMPFLISRDAFEAWLFFDVSLQGGRRVADVMLDPRAGLPAGARAYLTSMRRSTMRLYEVVAVQRGASLTLRDIIGSTGQVTVQELSASRELVRWDMLAARVVSPGASGRPEIDGGIFPIHRSRREQVVEHLREELREFREEEPDASEDDFFGTLPPYFHAIWRDPPPRPKLVNSAGDPLVLTKLHFTVTDPARAAHELDTTPKFQREPDAQGWVWIGVEDDEVPVVFGRAEIAGDELVLQTDSVERAELGLSVIAMFLGGLATYQTTTTTDLEAAMTAPGPGAAPVRPPAELPAELQAAVQEALQQHYQRWTDEPIPMLDGATPRAASRSTELRPRLIEMLKDLERAHEREQRSGQHSFDPSFLWDELGLRGERELLVR